MGQFLSLAGNWNATMDYCAVPQAEQCKRRRLNLGESCLGENPRLIPSLPDEISVQILARLPRIHYLNLRLVSRSWKAALTGSEVYSLRKELGTTEEWLYILTKIDEDKLSWHAFDPLSGKWQRLPPMPEANYEDDDSRKFFSGLRTWSVVGSSLRIADVIKGWLGRKDSFERMPFCGCSIGAVDGCLYVLGGFSRASAMKCVWRYNPCANAWSEVSSMSVGRAYCKTALLNNKLYVVGGVSRTKGGLTPLQSAEVFDPKTENWEQVPSMPFSRAQVLPTAFLADMLKPIATGMASYRGSLCVPQSLYSWPFFVDVGGEIFDPETNAWTEMPNGMGEGWPARQAGTKLSVVVDGELYALDPSSSLDSGRIKIYDHQEDAWRVVLGRVPVIDFTDSESPYLLAGFLGKLHVITKDVSHGIAILQADMRKPCDSYPSTSASPSSSSWSASSSSSSSSSQSPPPLPYKPSNVAEISIESEEDTWITVASKNFGSSELVSCQVLDV
ncbi:unnamed protein product [Victoria cruziana]